MNQNRAPIYEALEQFRKNKVVPFDVPGHKRGRGNPELVQLLGKQCVELDVNSMKPLDNLCHPISVIKEAEELAAEAFGASHAFLMVGGTTSAVQSMVLTACKKGEKIILPRNVHRSVINALVVNGATPIYVNPDVDEKLGAMLLRYVPAANSADHAPRERVFRSLYEQRRPAAPDETALPRYEDVLGDVLSNARAAVTAKNDARLMPFLPSIERALTAMETFRDSARYLIHGDAHEYNMLVEDGGCVLIDPLGYVAPIEFEFARYLGTAMKKHPLSNAEMDALVSRILPGGVDRARALSAFAIDTTLRGCNTFIEGNTCEEIVFGGSWAARAWNYADALSQPAKEGKRHVS